MSTTATHAPSWGPTITLTKRDDGGFGAVFAIEGLNPTRIATPEERAAGIASLNPPTVTVRARRVAGEAHRELIDISQRAVSTACTQTEGQTGGPAALAILQFKTAIVVRQALRLLGEDI